MNERIEHCLYQAGLTASGCWDELGTYEQEAIEKFAELLIKECAGVCESATQKGNPLHIVSLGYSQRLKEHFGVEE